MNSLEKARFPLMETPIIAFFLAVAAGSMDGYTYQVAKAFSTVMSGNIILLGQTLATKDLAKFGTVALTLLCFGLGSAATAVVQLGSAKKRKSWTVEILLVEVIVLVLLGFNIFNNKIGVEYVCMIISFLAGMQGNAFHKIEGMLYGNVAVTLVVQLAFSYAIQAVFGKQNAVKNSALFFLVLLGFAVGGFLGTYSTIQWGEKSLWLTAAILLIIAFLSKGLRKVNPQEAVDPT